MYSNVKIVKKHISRETVCFVGLCVAALFTLACCDAQGQTVMADGQKMTYSSFFAEQRFSVPIGGEFVWDNTTQSEHRLAEFGATVTYLPQHVGLYGGLSLLRDVQLSPPVAPTQFHPVLTVGGALRPFHSVGLLDFHMYGGISLCRRPGVDIGIRVAAGSRYDRSRFSWWSCSLGISNRWNVPFITAGLSVGMLGVSVGTLADVHFLWYSMDGGM